MLWDNREMGENPIRSRRCEGRAVSLEMLIYSLTSQKASREGCFWQPFFVTQIEEISVSLKDDHCVITWEDQIPALKPESEDLP